MSALIEMLHYPFMQRALIVGVLVSLSAALLGVILVLKRYSLIGHGLGEVGFASLSLSTALGLPQMAVSVPMVGLGAVFIMWLSRKKKIGGDAAIGVISTGALSFGVIITSLTQGFNIDVSNYMFGSILALTESDLLLSAVLSVVVIVMFVVLFNRLFSVTYDEVNAQATGVNVDLYQMVIALLTAVTVVLGMRMMGTMLISSLIIFPAMAARRLTHSFRGMVALSATISVVCFLIGLALSFLWNLPTGASVVACDIAALLLATLWRKIAGGEQ
ncbi:MAG: metal ABC transporter permease [Eubacteriales bacterium]|nr:metal ABC transporter permease [Eubacteriales bacterium]